MDKRIINTWKLKYKHLINIVKKEVKEIGIKPLTDIRVYLDYPFGWHATVGSLGIDDKPYVYIFVDTYGKRRLIIEECLGVRKNGSLMFSEIE